MGPPGVSPWMTTLMLDRRLGLTKEQLIPALKQQGIDVRPFFYPLSAIPAYRSSPQAALARDRNVVSYAVAPFGVNLPSALSLKSEDVATVCDALRRCLASADREGLNLVEAP